MNDVVCPSLKKNQNAPRPSEHPPIRGEKIISSCFHEIQIRVGVLEPKRFAFKIRLSTEKQLTTRCSINITESKNEEVFLDPVSSTSIDPGDYVSPTVKNNKAVYLDIQPTY